MFLREVADLSNPAYADLQQMFVELAAMFDQHLDVLTEALTPVEGDMDQQLAELSKRFDAAKRGLSLAHKLPAGPAKKKHMSAILTNMNIIRGMLQQVNKQLVQQITQFGTAEQDYEMGVGYEQEEEASSPYNQAVDALRGVMGR